MTIKERLTNRIIQIRNDVMSGIYTKISTIDEFKGWFKAGFSLSPQILGRLKRTTIITSAGASTRIEGSKMTDAEVELFLKNVKINRMKDRDSQEVAGYAELMKTIFDNFGNIRFGENQILHLHKILLQYSEKDSSHLGKYKTSSNKVVARDRDGNEAVIFRTSEPYITPIEMKDLIDWTRDAFGEGKMHPLLITANFILEFLSIHPFKDGNGRLSRALTNLIMLQSGYNFVMYTSMEKIIEDNKSEYYLSLRKSQKEIRTDGADIVPWLEFFMDTVIKQMETVKKYAEDEAVEEMLSEKQAAIIRLFDKHEVITNNMIVEELSINRDTAKQSLSRLVKLQFIKRIGRGRNIKYIRIVSGV
ncbi:MAG: Fic family protein [Oligoflexia bacterium]|nr:Fic family protein [Oligoflexia bacterium]